jgi:serine/threonine-protein kinase
VLDFGISKLPTHRMTKTSAMMGSPAYMSPEQVESPREVDVRADVWSLGAMLYELVTGKPPFRAETLVELTVAIREREPDPPEGIPDELARVIAKCLSKKASDRYPSAAELALALAPLAPPDVGGIVTRLKRQMTDETVNVTPPQLVAIDSSKNENDEQTAPAGGEHDLKAQETFAPLQTTHAEKAKAKWPMALAAVLAIAAAVAGVLRMKATDAPSPTNGASDGAAVVASGAPDSAPVPVVVIEPVVSAPIASESPPPIGPTKPVVRPPVHHETAAPPAVSSAPTIVAPAATPTPSASVTPPAATGPKRRTLDRDDP